MRLVIHKYKRIENLTINVPAEIRAGNGIGKSTAVEAFSFCFTGKNLQGKEIESVYDTRVDLHEAIADVSFFDDYNNEYRRTVKPVFYFDKKGIEQVKTLCSTTCSKNGIPCNDFSGEFSDFLKFGTDYFFRLKPEEQRNVFIDLLKSKLPDYDIKTALERRKELEKAQRETKADIELKSTQLKSVKDVAVSIIHFEISAQNDEFLRLSQVDNSKAIEDVNKANNELIEKFSKAKKELLENQSSIERAITANDESIQKVKSNISELEAKIYSPLSVISTTELKKQVEDVKSELKNLKFYETLEQYYDAKADKNPVVSENMVEIERLSGLTFEEPKELTSNCPLSGEFCETAKLHSLSAAKLAFSKDIESEIITLKAENRTILTKEMSEVNNNYLTVKSKLDRLEKELTELEADNEKSSSNYETLKNQFEEGKKHTLKSYETQLHLLSDKKTELEKQFNAAKLAIDNFIEPILQKLPEDVAISEHLITAHDEFLAIEKEITGQTAINENNVKLRAEYNESIKALQKSIFEIGEKLAVLNTEISDYFSNLGQVVKTEFPGDIEIDVQLLEYVLTKNEWKDCFKITANGCVFPSECNGALQSNLKLQLLAGFQRLANYTGVTLMDNCEGNTTQPIDTCGLKTVLAFATFDKELTIK